MSICCRENLNANFDNLNVTIRSFYESYIYHIEASALIQTIQFGAESLRTLRNSETK